VIINAGLPTATVVTDGDAIDLTGQVFERVSPVNHLGTATPPAPPAPDPPPVTGTCRFEPTDQRPVLDAIAALEARIADLERQLDDQPPAGETVVFPHYTGKILGFKVTLRPEVLP